MTESDLGTRLARSKTPFPKQQLLAKIATVGSLVVRVTHLHQPPAIGQDIKGQDSQTLRRHHLKHFITTQTYITPRLLYCYAAVLRAVRHDGEETGGEEQQRGADGRGIPQYHTLCCCCCCCKCVPSTSRDT